MRMFLASVLLAFCSLITSGQPLVVAHRGYWRTEGSAQNSITSLQKAAQAGCWGSEFDVWLTADGVPVVFHDATIDGIRIEDTTFATLMNHRLQNGEFIPTLQQYLHEATRWPLCRLILEVKPHRNAKRDASISKLAVELVETMGLASRTDYISFSKDACKRLHELAPEAKVAYLNGDLTPLQVKEMGLTGIDYSAATFDKHPEWPLEAKKLGLEVNVWTVDGEEELHRFGAMKGIDIITTNDPDILIKTLGNKK
ncbi:MAG: glycerophosphodiester phosphodiesterase [Bacteroidaceae bacterium]|nr:glycerophosphodiester phosphodiesterase [Bacteroidaceae bacterium]